MLLWIVKFSLWLWLTAIWSFHCWCEIRVRHEHMTSWYLHGTMSRFLWTIFYWLSQQQLDPSTLTKFCHASKSWTIHLCSFIDYWMLYYPRWCRLAFSNFNSCTLNNIGLRWKWNTFSSLSDNLDYKFYHKSLWYHLSRGHCVMPQRTWV